MIRGLGHIGLFTRDIEKSKSFYTEVLAFKIISETENSDGAKIAMAQQNDCMLELVQLPGYDGYIDGYFNHFSLVVDDIMKAKDVLESKGIAFEMQEPVLSNVFNGVKYLMFRGPDGEHLEINEII